ncbi:MAG: sulfate adenylyltransferase subunit CysN [Methylovulum sp.]
MSHQSDLISSDINAYLAQHERKELLRFLTCGNVDDGKSTLIGRLLHDSKMIYEDQLAAVQADSVKSGTTGAGKIDLALLVDGLQAEREQGITIDVAYRYFSTATRKFIIADTPGHEQYTRNMATGASTCDLAIILIDARYGVQTQTKRHSFIASLLGIKHIIVAINKMDLVEYSEAVFTRIKQEYLAFIETLNLQDVMFIPMSALDGDNVVNASEHMAWFTGVPLMEALNTVVITDDSNMLNARFPVQYVNRPNLDFRGFCGTVASGIFKKGDAITVLPSGKTSHIKAIISYDGELEEAWAAMAVTFTLSEEIDVSRGDMIVGTAHKEPKIADKFQAHIVWMAEQSLTQGRQYIFKLGASSVTGSISFIDHRIDVNTLEFHDASELKLNEIALCTVAVNAPVVFDSYQENRNTGAFIIIDRLSNGTVGAGMIVGEVEENLLIPVTSEERSQRYNQRPICLSLLGEQATAYACQLERKLFNNGHLVIVLEGNELSLVEHFKHYGALVLTINDNNVAADLNFFTEHDSIDSIYNELKDKGYIY